jgi:ribosome-binding protein aMBF1 (putative translation factor)
VVLSIPISVEAEAKLAEKAKAAGVDVPTYAARHLELIARAPRPLREISGPIADAFEKSGMSEEELADLLESEKHAMRAEKRARRAG